MTSGPAAGPLEQLATARGVAVSYVDAFARVRRVGPDTLVAVLAALGEPIAHPGDAPDCLVRRAARQPPQPPPVVVAWDGGLENVARAARQGAGMGTGRSRRPRRATAGGSQLLLEDGSDATGMLEAAAGLPPNARDRLPFGYHALHTAAADVIVISAPVRVRPLEPRSWGLFAPTYALRDERGRGSGDLTCLERLGRLAGSLGASYLATLPLLADYCATDEPAGRPDGGPLSPYSPLSRMWWNEAYLDVDRVPGLSGAGRLASGAPEDQLPADPPENVDLAGVGARVRSFLQRGLDGLAASRGARRAAFEAFQRERPDVVRYAAFRAAAEAKGTDRARWPAHWVAGRIAPDDDVSAASVERHMYAQWLTDEQVAGVAASTASRGCRLMLDLPVGCRPDGYDTWAFPSSFAGAAAEPEAAGGVSVGAPPDAFFGEGQNWGFRPLDPEGERLAGYPVVRGSLSHLLRHAGALRIDHVLGFQRLWWIPAGASPREGAYVSYPSEELVALACLEAWRRDATVVGEDLGTVDPELRALIGAHGIAGMNVAVFDLERQADLARQEPPGAVAFVDTHDTATFAGWLESADIDQRQRLGLLADKEAGASRRRRL
ncbi:MAG TPA: 4-alpha-glucanotransferase, partial [Acidimicrobiales bacterium]|nr:4-alpha-glucanotransferase [Acidimicrobiales bacterium]